jgi:signal peptidase I
VLSYYQGGVIRKRTVLAATIGIAAIAAAGVQGLSRRFAVVEDSMRPALEPGDWLVTQRRRGAPERGDIVVYSRTDEPGRFFIKRIVGLPGERVSISDGQVHIDGLTLAEPWANGPTFPDGDGETPHDAVWVLGDNRALSSGDSRSIGAVALDDIEWKAVAIYWPSSRIGLV